MQKAEFHQSAAFGKVSFGFNFNWFCDVPAAAKV
jgi:hypothetical protein